VVAGVIKAYCEAGGVLLKSALFGSRPSEITFGFLLPIFAQV
jgi:hypothetical protein